MKNEGGPQEGLVSKWHKEQGVTDTELAAQAEETAQRLVSNEREAAHLETERGERARPLAREIAEALSEELNAALDTDKTVAGIDKLDIHHSLLGLAKRKIETDERFKDVRPSEVVELLHYQTFIEGNSGKTAIGKMEVRETEAA